ncbi:MAG: hypothetical protein AB1585_03120 [Thermodesulfobacteriota bacterium]
MEESIKYILNVQPALPVKDRQKLAEALKALKYEIIGQGQRMDGSECDISFRPDYRETNEEYVPTRNARDIRFAPSLPYGEKYPYGYDEKCVVGEWPMEKNPFPETSSEEV